MTVIRAPAKIDEKLESVFLDKHKEAVIIALL
jgi:hypothetical protein